MSKWLTGTVLKVLAERQLCQAGSTFLATDLTRWLKPRMLPELLDEVPAMLGQLGLAELDAEQGLYRLTLAGAAAVGEAIKGLNIVRCGTGAPLKPDSTAARLWALLRMRSMIDSDSAARTLCTAGADDYKLVRATVTRCLYRWYQAGALEESARRLRGPDTTGVGLKRYVLKPEYKRCAKPPVLTAALRAARQKDARS